MIEQSLYVADVLDDILAMSGTHNASQIAGILKSKGIIATVDEISDIIRTYDVD